MRIGLYEKLFDNVMDISWSGSLEFVYLFYIFDI